MADLPPGPRLDLLRALRELHEREAKPSVREISAKTYVSPAKVYDALSGRRPISLDVALHVADFLVENKGPEERRQTAARIRTLWRQAVMGHWPDLGDEDPRKTTVPDVPNPSMDTAKTSSNMSVVIDGDHVLIEAPDGVETRKIRLTFDEWQAFTTDITNGLFSIESLGRSTDQTDRNLEVETSRPQLTAREIDVLKAWFCARTKTAAASSLGLSAKTVETYIQRVRAKYADVGRPAPSKAALVARALQDQIIEVTDAFGSNAGG